MFNKNNSSKELELGDYLFNEGIFNDYIYNSCSVWCDIDNISENYKNKNYVNNITFNSETTEIYNILSQYFSFAEIIKYIENFIKYNELCNELCRINNINKYDIINIWKNILTRKNISYLFNNYIFINEFISNFYDDLKHLQNKYNEIKYYINNIELNFDNKDNNKDILKDIFITDDINLHNLYKELNIIKNYKFIINQNNYYIIKNNKTIFKLCDTCNYEFTDNDECYFVNNKIYFDCKNCNIIV